MNQVVLKCTRLGVVGKLIVFQKHLFILVDGSWNSLELQEFNRLEQTQGSLLWYKRYKLLYKTTFLVKKFGLKTKYCCREVSFVSFVKKLKTFGHLNLRVKYITSGPQNTMFPNFE